MVSVIIPIYKEELTPTEEISIQQCFKVLGKYPIVCVKPQSLECLNVTQQFNFTEVVDFDEKYFDSIQGYNQLMTSTELYQKFLKYEFILLYQLDAFVFKNDLEYWCNSKFDYVGAPWLRLLEYPDIVKKIKSEWQTYYDIKVNKQSEGIPSDTQFENKVGNGGFSLRRVKKFYDLTIKFKSKIEFYNNQSDHRYHEDVFWSIEVNRFKKELKIPHYKKAVEFSFENIPERCLKFNQYQLPFGCHAWDKHIDFWTPHFKACGYDLEKLLQ